MTLLNYISIFLMYKKNGILSHWWWEISAASFLQLEALYWQIEFDLITVNLFFFLTLDVYICHHTEVLSVEIYALSLARVHPVSISCCSAAS